MTSKKLRYRALPLFASPLEEHSEHHHGHEPTPHGHDSPSSSQVFTGKEPFTTEEHQTPPALASSLVFREREEASSIELFYDLFFVANLSSFTGTHSIDDESTVKSYIGFFALLWFNWLQVTLYDVRFGVDSIFERVCKALHLGIMIAFAVVGTQFNTNDTATYSVTFQQFSCIMMISKLILLIQYGYILYWVRGHTKVVAPILIHMAAFAIGAIICLGLIFSFNDHTQSNSYVAWYVIAVMEALTVFVSSSWWRSVSFKRSNLNERVGLLTLIILGEGVIVLTKSMSYVTKGANYSPAVIGQIIASVLIIYFLYMLYFDQVDAKRFGSIRQQFWALAHFPFHVALVLLLEGTSRFVTWRNATEMIDYLALGFGTVYNSSNDTDTIASNLGLFATEIFNAVEADVSKYNITSYLSNLAASGDPNSDEAYLALADIFASLQTAVFKFFKISAAESVVKASKSNTDGAPKDPFKDLGSVFHVYDLVFVYFFVAAGCTLLMMAILIALAKKNKCAGDYAAIALRAIVGLALTLVAAVKGNYTAQEHFLFSPWMLPTVLLAIVIVVVVDGVLGYVLPAPKTQELAGHGEPHAHGHA